MDTARQKRSAETLTAEKRNAEYVKYVETKTPKTPPWRSLIPAFLVGGFICILSESFHDILLLIFKTMTEEDARTWALVTIIFLAVLLTGLGVFDDINYFAGAGTFLPITGFANATASPALEFKSEGMVFGLGAKMFYVSGPVIVNGVVLSIVGALINFLIYGVILK